MVENWADVIADRIVGADPRTAGKAQIDTSFGWS